MRRCDADEYVELLYFMEHIEPVGYDRSDLQAGVIASAVANSQRSRGRRAVPNDYMPVQAQRKKRAQEAMSADDQARAVFGAMMRSQRNK